MPLKVWDGSSWVTASRMKVWNGSTWADLSFGKVWNGSVWTTFYTGLQATINAATYIRYTASPASLQFNADGYVYASSGSTQLVQDYLWKTGGGVAGDYEIYVDVVSGITPSGSSTGVWLPLSSTRQWDVTAALGNYRESKLDVLIRMAASPNTVLAGTVTITVGNDRT